MPLKELEYISSANKATGYSTGKEVILVDIADVTDTSKGRFQNFCDSFERYDAEGLGIDPNLSEVQKTAILTANAPLSRTLKNRHIQMIAIGGSIGTGLFVGSGKTLHTGGPAGVLIGYLLIGSMIYCTCQSLGELAVTFPVSGAFVTYNTRFLDSSWGFAMAWNYAMQWFILFPLEMVAASITIKFWNSDINPAAFVAIFYVLICSINLFGAKGYGEAEFYFAMVKVIAIIGFIILGIVLVCGGGPLKGYIGGKYWSDPGAFNHDHSVFKGVCSVFVTAAFAFGGTELVGLAAAESKNPRKALPKATKQVFWRITLFYVICLTLVGLLVPYNDPRLLSGSSSVDASASPFVIAIKNGGIKGLPSVMNVVIMISVLSVGNSSVYASSRTLAALAAAGQAPKFLNYIDRAGRPIFGIMVQFLWGLLAFVCASGKEGVMFNWLLALSGLSSLFTWGSINLCHIRFRHALKVKGRDTSELSFSAQTGVYGSYYAVFIVSLVLIAQFWIALFPLGASPDAETFFMSYLGFPVIIAFYIAHKIFTRNWKLYIKADDIDIDTGRRELDLDVLKQEIEEERKDIASKPLPYRLWAFWC